MSSTTIGKTATSAAMPAICYLRGTRILTPSGEVAIESLTIGDRVMGRFGGFQRIKWIGWQCYDAYFLRNHRGRIPVYIRPGALGDNIPTRGLFVSPSHALLIGNDLILASALVNSVTITQSWEDAPGIVEYFQIELERHDCVLADGVWAETYADGPGLRAQFHNFADYAALYPDEAPPQEIVPPCAPRLLSGPALEAALLPVVGRATAGYTPARLEGYVDYLTPASIGGWAIDAHRPDLPVSLSIYDGETLAGTVLACAHRKDLLDAGIGNGNHAFLFRPARPIPVDRVRVTGANGEALPHTADCAVAV